MATQKLPILHAPKALAIAALFGATACLFLTACGEDEAPPPPVVRAPVPPPPPPPEPTITSIEELMATLKIDERVNLPEGMAPDTTEKRIAVLKFWNAFAKGDDKYAGANMSKPDQKILADLVKNGSWSQSTGNISSIEVQCKDETDGFATFAIISSGGTEQPLLWDAAMSGDDAVFTAFPGTTDILKELSGEDSITAWKTYINGLFEKYANLPDEEIEIPQTDIQVAAGDDASSGGDGGGGNTPTPPGGGAGGGALRKKPRPPIPD